MILDAPSKPWELFFKGTFDRKNPYRYDKRIREWCFGSFDGAYDGDLFMGGSYLVSLRVDDFHQLSLMELAESSKWMPRDGLNSGEP